MEDKRISARGNAAQMRAITHGRGPAVVLAGPGSGKTFVVAERVKALIEQGLAPPSNILTITFTRAAAAEMRRRFLRITDGRYPEVNFGTFHSIFYQILKLSHQSSLDHAPNIITETEKRRIASLLVSDLARSFRDITPSAELSSVWLSEISRLKSEGAGCEAARESIPHREAFAGFYSGYARMLKELNRLDLDDILTECLALLLNDGEALRLWQDKFRFILIDEYQDINRVQFEAVKLLSLPENNLFAVGDDDQSIYGFRGSRPDIMLDFERDFPGAKRIILDVNYRCSGEIIKASSLVIRQNRKRFEKETRPGRERADSSVSVMGFASPEEELKAMADCLLGCERPERAAVILRTNAQAAVFSEKLSSAGLRVNTQVKNRDRYDDKAVEDILAYLRLSGSSPERSDLFRVMNRPMRYLSRECARKEPFELDDILKYYRDRGELYKQAEGFIKSLKMIGGMRPALGIRYIRTQLKYDSFVKRSGEYALPERSLKLLESLQEEAGDFLRTEAFLKAVSEKRESLKRQGASVLKGEGVNILTMHAAKGLEFDLVWLPELNEGNIPSKRQISEEQLEEERRLFYVAMTRAKDRLIMSYLTGGEGYAYMPSRFLKSLTANKAVI